MEGSEYLRLVFLSVVCTVMYPPPCSNRSLRPLVTVLVLDMLYKISPKS